MWSRKKYKNRRLGQIHVLDVRLRSDQVRRFRMRLTARVFGVLFGAALGTYLVWRSGEWVLNRMVYQNPTFAITTIEAQSDGSISPELIRRWAGVKPGQNLLALDLARVKRDLEMTPQLSMVSVERVLPRTLRIRVTEREAVAQVVLSRPKPGGGMQFDVFHLDPEGYVLIPLDPRQRTVQPGRADDSLPTLGGLKQTELLPGRAVESPTAKAALRFILEFGCSPMAGVVDLRKIDCSATEVLTVTTGQGSEITFGLHEFDRQLRRWREIHDMGQRMNRNLATLDLAVTNNIPARWLEANLVPPAPAKTPKTLRNRKSNV